VRSWPENHLPEMAEVVAGMAVAVALVFCYWAAGGSFGLSDAQPHPSFGLQASRVAGAVVAVVGLLGLAGRWGRQTRLWLPAALTWVGSGAVAAFDGLNLVVNRLFVMFGIDASEAGWSLFDTVLVIKVVIGVLAAAVGALAVTAAAKDNQKPAGTQRTGMQTTTVPIVPLRDRTFPTPWNASATEPVHTSNEVDPRARRTADRTPPSRRAARSPRSTTLSGSRSTLRSICSRSRPRGRRSRSRCRRDRAFAPALSEHPWRTTHRASTWASRAKRSCVGAERLAPGIATSRRSTHP
jgi:hypothetical protein